MLGKLKLALAPALPEWNHASLQFSARGLTTSALPAGDRAVEASIDVFDSALSIATSDDQVRTIALDPPQPIAEVWRQFAAALDEVGIEVNLWDKPQELDDVTPFADDLRPRSIEPKLAQGWFALLSELHGVFDEWRSPFFGRSGVHFWWGGFDMSVVLFNGRHATPPAKANWIGRYDLDAEHVTVGFWPGDSQHDARFYGYVVPEPPGCPDYRLELPSASWAPSMGEWVLDYESVRKASDRRQLIIAFADTILAAARDLAGWPLEEFTYVRPPRLR